MKGFLRAKFKLQVINGWYSNHVQCASFHFLFHHVSKLQASRFKNWKDLKVKINSATVKTKRTAKWLRDIQYLVGTIFCWSVAGPYSNAHDKCSIDNGGSLLIVILESGNVSRLQKHAAQPILMNQKLLYFPRLSYIKSVRYPQWMLAYGLNSRI